MELEFFKAECDLKESFKGKVGKKKEGSRLKKRYDIDNQVGQRETGFK